MKIPKQPIQFDPFAERFLAALCGAPDSPFTNRTELARFCEISPNALYAWRVNGIPKVWLRYFYALYPHLHLALPPAQPFPVAAAATPALVALLAHINKQPLTDKTL